MREEEWNKKHSKYTGKYVVIKGDLVLSGSRELGVQLAASLVQQGLFLQRPNDGTMDPRLLYENPQSLPPLGADVVQSSEQADQEFENALLARGLASHKTTSETRDKQPEDLVSLFNNLTQSSVVATSPGYQSLAMSRRAGFIITPLFT